MKKNIVITAAFLMLFSCQNEENKLEAIATVRRGCGTQEALEMQLKADPFLAIRMKKIEDFTKKAMLTNKLVNGKIVIPVVFNVIYRTTAENIPKTKLQEQVDLLNKDFNATNSDFTLVPPLFAGVKANVGITFTYSSLSVFKKTTTKLNWTTNDAMKIKSQGGINPTTPTTKLNIWIVGELRNVNGEIILGYSTFPGATSSIDGVVIGSKYVGNSGVANYPYNLGRTATHEIGHWMNLRHIWGEASCGDDLALDTPFHDSPNYGVPIYPHYSLCSGEPVEMTMNYMDYTDDRGMYMFTYDQKRRIDAIFISGGVRASFRN